MEEKKTTKKTTAPKKDTKKVVKPKEEVVEPKKVAKAKEVVKPKEEVKIEEVKVEPTIEIPVKEETPKKQIKVSLLTIILAISTIVLAILLATSSPKSTISLTEVFPDVFGEETATMKMPSGYMFSDDSYEMFKEEDGLLKAKGMVSAATYSDEEYEEMKTVYISQYGAIEGEKEGYDVLIITQENGDDIYNYYFFYKDTKLIQLVLLNCTETEINTIVKGINF